jgi:FHS family glucose/mannose:H+ symporter-like MFS transporter
MHSGSPNRLLKAVLHLAFFLSGTATVLIGQVLPIMAKRFALDDLGLSYFFPAQFAGSICGTLVGGRFGKRDRFDLATVVGCLLMTAGLLMMNLDAFPACLAGFFVNGLGIGITLPSVHMLIVEMTPEPRGSALSFLNFCWGAGAIVSKPFVDALTSDTSVFRPTLVLAIPLAVSALLLLLAGRPHLVRHADVFDDATKPRINIWLQPIAWAIALFNLIHVGFESGMGGWLTTYATRLPQGEAIGFVSPTFLYFLLFVAGRGFAPVLFRRLNENKMLMLGLVIVLLGMLIVLSAGSVLWLNLGAVVAGFGTSWIFPANVARFTRIFGPDASRSSTPLFICGTIGAAVSTWSIGFISEKSGSLNSGMYVLLISVLLLIGLQVGLSIAARSKVNQDPAL